MEVKRETPTTNGRSLDVEIDDETIRVEISKHPDWDRRIDIERDSDSWGFAIDEETAEPIAVDTHPEWVETLLWELGIQEVGK